MRRSCFFAAIVALCGMLLPVKADAQGPAYRPTRPTLSPWFNLYNRNPGPLDNYHTYVRPEMELRQTLQQQNAGIRQNSSDLRSLGREMSGMAEGPIRPTGTASVFMNYSHYYPQSSSASAAAARPRAPARQPPRRSSSSYGSVGRGL